MRRFLIVAALASAVLGISQPAAAGTVRVEGSAVVFEAGNNQINRIVVDPRGSVLDPATGQSVPGFTVRDLGTSITAGAGCRKIAGIAVCDITNASFVSIDLGDKDDEASQAPEGDPGNAVPMRVKGGPGNDTLTGGNRGDILDGDIGDDTIDGGDGNDTLIGGAGVDTITGGRGSDTIDAGLGRDVINTQDGQQDSINCGLNRDTLTADASDTKKRCN